MVVRYCQIGNQIKGMNTYMPILECDLLHIEQFSADRERLAFHESALVHDPLRFLLPAIDHDGCNGYQDENQKKTALSES